MAFGFLVEKFDIFLSYLSHEIGQSVQLKSSLSLEYIGLGLMLISVAVILGSTIRFFHNARAIESMDSITYHVKWPNISMALLMLILALFLVFYMIFQVLKI